MTMKLETTPRPNYAPGAVSDQDCGGCDNGECCGACPCCDTTPAPAEALAQGRPTGQPDVDALANLIRAALMGERAAGFTEGRYIYAGRMLDPEAEHEAAYLEAKALSHTTTVAMWRAFYDAVSALSHPEPF